MTNKYSDYREAVLSIVPRIALMSEKDWKIEGSPSIDEWLMRTRGVDYDTALKYPHRTGWNFVEENLEGETPPKKRGRPKGSKNKPKRPLKLTRRKNVTV